MSKRRQNQQDLDYDLPPLNHNDEREKIERNKKKKRYQDSKSLNSSFENPKKQLKLGNFDDPQKSDWSGFPRRYREILQMEERRRKKSNVNTDGGKSRVKSDQRQVGGNSGKKLEIQPGESLKEFSQRVDKTVQMEINKNTREMSKTKQKKKEALKQRKEKLKKSKKSHKKSSEEDEFVKYNQLKKQQQQQNEGKLSFQIQADAPPTLTSVPKNRPAPASLRKLTLGNQLDQDPKCKLLLANQHVSPKITVEQKNKSLAEKRLLNIEREKAIHAYRLQKQRKIVQFPSFIS